MPDPVIAQARGRRGGRLQVRMARYIAFAVVVTLIAGTASTIVYRHIALRGALEDSARRFAALVGVPLTQIADMYGGTEIGPPVDAMVARLFELNGNVERLDLVNANGRMIFSATRNRITVPPRDEPWPLANSLIASGSGAGSAVEAERVREGGRSKYRVVVPRHQVGEPFAYSLVATFSYSNLNRQLRQSVIFAAFALVLGLIITERVSVALARGITRNLELLQNGVRRLRAGHLDERVELDSGDEIEELADAFNEMTAELELTIDRLRSANFELHTLDQMKADLVANVSHELRTPLTALKGYLELLDAGSLGGLSDEACRAVSVCRRNADRLALRVEDLVQMSQMEKTWPELWSEQPVNLATIIDNVVDTFEMRIRDKDLAVGIDAPPDLPFVTGNVERIERLVLNLIDNAVKFTPDGGAVTVIAEECDHDHREGVLLRVVDNGIGIPESELVRVFDRFHQVDPSIRRRFGGMGLGLSLVQRIVDSHRGVVWAESGSDGGSVFSVWLPCRPREGSDD